jgi:hypothetical protein
MPTGQVRALAVVAAILATAAFVWPWVTTVALGYLAGLGTPRALAAARQKWRDSTQGCWDLLRGLAQPAAPTAGQADAAGEAAAQSDAMIQDLIQAERRREQMCDLPSAASRPPPPIDVKQLAEHVIQESERSRGRRAPETDPKRASFRDRLRMFE